MLTWQGVLASSLLIIHDFVNQHGTETIHMDASEHSAGYEGK
jgi:hypothetical protein